MKFCKGCRAKQDDNQFQANRAQCLTCRKKTNAALSGVFEFEPNSRAKIEFKGLTPLKDVIQEWLATDPQKRINDSLLPTVSRKLD